MQHLLWQEAARLKAEETALQAKKRADEAEKMRQELLAAQQAAEREAAQVCTPDQRVVNHLWGKQAPTAY